MKKRGQVWWIRFDPSEGSEIQKTRPAVILSNNASNKRLQRCIVVPFSSQMSKIHRAEVEIKFKGKPTKAMVDQLTTVSYNRMLNKAGLISRENIEQIEKAIITHLDLPHAEEE